MNTVKVICFVTKPEQKEAAVVTFPPFLYCQLFDADIKDRINWFNLVRQEGLLLEVWKENTLYPVLLLVSGALKISGLECTSQRRNCQCLESCLKITECGGHWRIPAPWKINADNKSKATRTAFSFTHSEFYFIKQILQIVNDEQEICSYFTILETMRPKP